MEKLNYQSGYEKYLYTGLAGKLMKRNHIHLSSKVPDNLNKSILEIGGGAAPHFSFIKLKDVKEYWISDNEYLLSSKDKSKENSSGFQINYHYADVDPSYQQFFEKNIKFSRIVISHVWEHLPNPEKVFLDWINLLEENGRLDIAIPCDPGIVFRIGQLIGRKKAMKNYNMSFKEVELMHSREHINPSQNLLRIANFYTKCKLSYFPFKIPFINLNLFIFIRVYKKDFQRLLS